jgi:hypothetical protein
VPVPEPDDDLAHEVSVASSENKTFARRLLNASIGFGAFALTCLGLHALLPFPPNIDQVSQKLQFFCEHKDEFDTLFIGSSRIHYQISPAVFDATMREAGAPTRSFNFGVDGMHLPESAYVLEQVLSTRPRNLKWVFVEFDELQTNWLFQGEGSRRALYWHDWRRTSLVLRKLFGAGTSLLWLPKPKKIRDIILCRKAEANTHKLVTFHAAQFQKNFTNVARAPDVADYFSHPKIEAVLSKQLGPGGDGYVPITKTMSVNQVVLYQSALSKAMTNTEPKYVSPYTEKACRQCAQRIRSVSAAPIFLVTPMTVQSKLTFRGNPDPPGIVMSFNDARAYPNLYRTDVRLDQGHMSKTGAEEFTRLVATNFAQSMQARLIH